MNKNSFSALALSALISSCGGKVETDNHNHIPNDAQIQSDASTEQDANPLKNTIPQFWKIDAGQISYSEISGVAPLQFNFPNQGGNSGGPIVDAIGDVVSLHSKTKFHSPSQVFSCGPHITSKKIDTLVASARAELNPQKPKSEKKIDLVLKFTAIRQSLAPS